MAAIERGGDLPPLWMDELFLAQQLCFAILVHEMDAARLVSKEAVAGNIRNAAVAFSGITADYLNGFARTLARPPTELRVIPGGAAQE